MWLVTVGPEISAPEKGGHNAPPGAEVSLDLVFNYSEGYSDLILSA